MMARYWLMYLQSTSMLQNANRVIQKLRQNIHLAVLKSDLAFHAGQNSGMLLAQVLTYPQQIGNSVQAIANLAVHVLLVAGYSAVLIYLSPALSLVVVPVIVLIAVFYRQLMQRSSQIGRAFNEDTSRLTVEAAQQFQGIRLIKLRFQEETHLARFLAASLRNLKLYYEGQRINLLISSTINPLLIVAGVVMIYSMVRWGGVGLAELGVFAVALLRLLPVVGTLNVIRANLYTLLPSVDIYEQFLRRATEGRVLLDGSQPCTKIKQGIRFEDVTFSYGKSDEGYVPAVYKVSLDIPRGKTIALVGRSGAGKSTIVDLLARLYDPTAGRITLDGKPLTDYRIGDLRGRISLMSQDSFLFDASIRQNISFGSGRSISGLELESLLKRAHAWDFVQALPDGADAEVGERGTRLSGGQRQRIALARGLAQNPDLLILDEPTSALDGESEEAVQQALRDLHGTLTIVIVAHRLSTIRNADLIYVLDAGRVVASGTHDALLTASNLYRRLFEAQLVELPAA